ncbi:MAG TPA: hypothetical protein VL326_13630 [Kofleriaceae bacterium]|jgi:hypothetical protein|nr:hypothetical protein [Kofleriaceae bacterium]
MKRTLLLLLLVGCVDTRDPITGTQSLRVELKSMTGSTQNRLDPNTATPAIIDVTAIGPDGQADTSYNNSVQVYVNYLGTLTPYLGNPPLATIAMSGGHAMNQSINLPRVFGPATLWLDDGTSQSPTYASGASDTIWYRDPFISDIQRPANPMALDALEHSPLELKQLRVDASEFGAVGKLVVTSVFAQGYTVSDVTCAAGGAPPCTTMPYHHAMVFSFSAARDEHFCTIKEGQTIDGFAGGVSEFNGLTEIGFPQSFDSRTAEGGCQAQEINPARIPPPVDFDATWFTNKIMFEENEAGLIRIPTAKVCNLDSDYATYKQWKIDPAGTGGDCKGNKNVINVISTGVVPTDPMTLVGKTVSIIGSLRPVNIGTFNVWIVYPRSAADLSVQ